MAAAMWRFTISTAATDYMLQTIEACPNWPVYADAFEHPPPACISMPNMVRHDNCRQNHAEVERIGRWLLWSTTLLLPTLLARFRSPSSFIHGCWWTIFAQVTANVVLTCTNGVLPNHLPLIVASDRPWTTWSLTKFEGGLNLLHKADDDAVIWLESTATAALAK